MTVNYSSFIQYSAILVLLVAGYFLSNGLLVELAISWLLLFLFEKKDPRLLGIVPTGTRTLQFLIGFVIATGSCAVYYCLQTLLSASTYAVNQSFTINKFLSGTSWTMQSVLYEEFIFRGALLYIAIKKIGVQKACILSAVCFGIYHWFSMGAFGNPFFMVYLFIGTGIMGYTFARAFAKTGSMYLPIALHFGWNLINNIIFSNGPNGKQLLILQHGDRFTLVENIIVLLVQLFLLPLLVFLSLGKLKWMKI